MKQKLTSQYLSNSAMVALLLDLKEEFPENVHTEIAVIGTTPENNEVYALHVWPRGRGVRQPTLWVDANMHAGELVGTNVVLAQIELLADRLRDAQRPTFETRNYIFVPRICPDGAERYFKDGLPSRSNARDRRSELELGPHWVRSCLVPKEKRGLPGVALLDNPNRIGVMRRENPAGLWATDAQFPKLLRRRDVNDPGPFYDVFPEGTIAHFDGVTLPSARATDRNEIDLNRNFPAQWKPSRQGEKSGPFPMSEPESRAVVEHSARHPEIYFWLNYHTFGGVFIRPPETDPDIKLPRVDASIFEWLDRDLERIAHYPAVSGFAEFLYQPDVPLPGTLTDWAYYGLGAFAYVCELWDLPIRLGHRERPFIKRYTHWSTDDWQALYRFDLDYNNGLLFGHPWIPFEHPQLGRVEVSELPQVFGIANPPVALIEGVIRPQLALFEHLVKIAPQPLCRAFARPLPADSATSAAPRLFEMCIEIANTGFLPTYISQQKNESSGTQDILVSLKDENNVRILGPSLHALPDLAGFAAPNTGWLDFAGNGSATQTSHVLRIPFEKRDPNAPARLSIETVFPRAGTHVHHVEV